MISKYLKILGLQPRISKVFSRSLEQFFLTVGQNNFGNKIPVFPLKINLQNNFIHRQLLKRTCLLETFEDFFFLQTRKGSRCQLGGDDQRQQHKQKK